MIARERSGAEAAASAVAQARRWRRAHAVTAVALVVLWGVAAAQTRASPTGKAQPVPAARLLEGTGSPPSPPSAPESSVPEPRVVTPESFATAGHRVHVFASEELNADSLGALARPGVVLWLQTRSNTLVPRVAEKLGRFEEAWVQVRPPFKAAQLEAIARTPRAGLWLKEQAALAPAVKRLAVRRIAVDVEGPLQEATSARLEANDVARIRWAPPAVDLESFARFAQLSAQKSLVLPSGATVPRCESGPVRALGTVSVITPPMGVAALSGCGFAARVPVEPDVDDRVLARIFQELPTAELEVQVGSDDRRAMRTRRLLERLEAASGTSASKKTTQRR